ncbi:hypothetical protein PQR34_39050, partial [Paraburkholderia sediminicola]|uniref:hypothetical protein n=1 Tax=Paraburkholderia sediminicola TaxID=458836 RepID=UPI0038BA784F
KNSRKGQRRRRTDEQSPSKLTDQGKANAAGKQTTSAEQAKKTIHALRAQIVAHSSTYPGCPGVINRPFNKICG